MGMVICHINHSADRVMPTLRRPWIIVFVLLLCACQSTPTLQRLLRSNSKSTPVTGGYLYEISHPAQQTRFHLFGTLHIAPKDGRTPLKRALLQTMAKADRIYIEAVMPAYIELAQSAPTPASQDARPGTSKMLKEFALHGASSFASSKNTCAFTTFGADAWIAQIAFEEGIFLRGLETVEERIDLLSQLSEDELKSSATFQSLQKAAAASGVAAAPKTDCADLQDSWNAWSKGDPAKSEGIANAARSDPLMKVLLIDRNELFFKRINLAVQDRGNFLFAVGAGHLFGREGLLQMLASAGYTIKLIP